METEPKEKNKLIFCAHLGVWSDIHTAYLGTKTPQGHTNILPWRNVPASLSDWSTDLSLNLDETQILIQKGKVRPKMLHFQ